MKTINDKVLHYCIVESSSYQNIHTKTEKFVHGHFTTDFDNLWVVTSVLNTFQFSSSSLTEDFAMKTDAANFVLRENDLTDLQWEKSCRATIGKFQIVTILKVFNGNDLYYSCYWPWILARKILKQCRVYFHQMRWAYWTCNNMT